MCNLYNLTEGPQAVGDIVRATRSDVGNTPPRANARYAILFAIVG